MTTAKDYIRNLNPEFIREALPERSDIDKDWTNRVPILIHPAVREGLVRLLNSRKYSTSGVGYSEFIRRAIEKDLDE